MTAIAIMMKTESVLERQEEGGYTADAPLLPGCISQGETRKEALRNIIEAISLHLGPDEDDTRGNVGSRVD